MTRLICMLVLPWLLYIIGSRASASGEEYGLKLPELSGDEEADLSVLLPYIYSRLPELYVRTLTDLSLTDEARDNILGYVEEYNLADMAVNWTGPSGDCVGCRAFVGLMQGAVVDSSYEEFETFFYDLCFDLINSTDEFGDTAEHMCPGITQNYVPPAYYVLNATSLDQRGICVLWNECLFNDFDPPLSEEDTLVCRPAPLPATVRQQPRRLKPSRPLNTIRILHLTDVHVDNWYDIGSSSECGLPSCCRDEWLGYGFAGYWGGATCNQPIHTTDVMLQYAASLDPHFVIYTGDSAPSAIWLDSVPVQKNTSKTVADSFRRNLPELVVYPALGNHDITPTNAYHHERPEVKELNRAYAAEWGPLANFGPEQIETFEFAAYYTILVQPGLRVLGYNTNYPWLENFYSILWDQHPDYLVMKQFMETTLNEARANGEKVLLVGHHPTGESTINNEYSCYVTDLEATFSDVIVLHVSGHKHGDRFRLVRDITTGESRGVQISSPAGTTNARRSPSMRIFHLDPVTFDLLDADTYRINMTRHYGAPDGSVVPEVKFAYSFTEEYNMADMSAQSFEDLIIRMQTDDVLFEKYRYNLATSDVRYDDDCDEECKTTMICELMNAAYPGVLACLGKI